MSIVGRDSDMLWIESIQSHLLAPVEYLEQSLNAIGDGTWCLIVKGVALQ